MKRILALTFIGCQTTCAGTVHAMTDDMGPHESEWSAVQTLASGTHILITATDDSSLDRYFVAADGTHLVVLNVTSLSIPPKVKADLRAIASSSPHHISEAQRGKHVSVNKTTIGPDGVLARNVKVAELGSIVEEFGVRDIVAVETAPSESNPIGCAFAAYFGGAVIGGLPGVLIGHAIGGDSGPALQGMAAGWTIGAVSLYGKCRHKESTVVYRVP